MIFVISLLEHCYTFISAVGCVDPPPTDPPTDPPTEPTVPTTTGEPPLCECIHIQCTTCTTELIKIVYNIAYKYGPNVNCQNIFLKYFFLIQNLTF